MKIAGLPDTVNVNLDPQFELGWVYKVSIKLSQAIRVGGIAKIENWYETTYNHKQPEVSITRAIREMKMNPEKAMDVDVKMLEQLSEAVYR